MRTSRQYTPKPPGVLPEEPWWLVLNPNSSVYAMMRVAEELIWKHGEEAALADVRERVVRLLARTERVPGPVLAELTDEYGIARTFVAVSS